MSSRISVIMPTFNRAGFIEEALDSLARQTLAPSEVIVVDDGSTDDTEQRVLAHELGSRIRYHRQSEQRGASVARNLAAKMARSELLVFLDSDDVLEPYHHSVATEALSARPDVGLFCCNARMIGPSGEWLHDGATWTDIQCSIKRTTISTGRRSVEDVFLFSICFPGLTIHRDLYLELGGLDQKMFPLDDYDLQLNAASRRTVFYEHRPLARYRDHGGNASGANGAVRVGEKKLECLARAWQRHPGLKRLGRRGRRRLGEARRELALSMLRAGRIVRGAAILGRSLGEDPAGVSELLRITRRKMASRFVRHVPERT